MFEVTRKETYITHERIESAQRCPTGTKCLGRVVAFVHARITLVAIFSRTFAILTLTETTDIGADHRNMIDACEAQNTGDRVSVVGPDTQVITEPLADFCTSTCKSGASNDESTSTWATAFHGFLGGGRNHGAVQIVYEGMFGAMKSEQ